MTAPGDTLEQEDPQELRCRTRLRSLSEAWEQEAGLYVYVFQGKQRTFSSVSSLALVVLLQPGKAFGQNSPPLFTTVLLELVTKAHRLPNLIFPHLGIL